MASGAGNQSSNQILSGRYATAVYDHAEEMGWLDRVIEEMDALGRLIDESPEFRAFLGNPLLDVQESTKAVRAVLQAQGFGSIVQDFVGVVSHNRRLFFLRAIVKSFADLVDRKRGVVRAQVVSAHPLTELQSTQLRARLTELGYGRVQIEEQVDESLLGGLVVKLGARLYDTSLKSRLQRLQYAMKGAA
ncbi:MAG TPA: F0F1 ATP synthase subunit delta [Acidisoma sp.]|uniref:F0F1 ATP synthase subunit delta n=1 Tax=Acidisoma sp. TaxID=1872115 RepID=UPI002C9DF1AA|nr:F0F1 ATP synthase subunit delta [Acidisoma sp.]HTI02393.1 F0F1 ATP synthase subunit delta [Acidisoma sp.]